VDYCSRNMFCLTIQTVCQSTPESKLSLALKIFSRIQDKHFASFDSKKVIKNYIGTCQNFHFEPQTNIYHSFEENCSKCVHVKCALMMPKWQVIDSYSTLTSLFFRTGQINTRRLLVQKK